MNRPPPTGPTPPFAACQQTAGMTGQEPVVTIPSGWLGTSEAAELAGYGVIRVQELARAGSIRAVKIGGEWLVHGDDLLQHHAMARRGPKPTKQLGTKALVHGLGRGLADAGPAPRIKRRRIAGVAGQLPTVMIPSGWVRTSEAAELAGCSTGRVRQQSISLASGEAGAGW